MTFRDSLPGIVILLMPMIVATLQGCDNLEIEEELLREIGAPATAEEIARAAENYVCVEDASGISCTPRQN